MRLSSARNFIVFVLAVVSLSSCKKDSSSESGYYVKFKMNGNWVTWKRALGELAVDQADPNTTAFALSAQNDASTELFNIGVSVSGSNFTTGTYTPDNSFMALSYMKNTNTPDFESYSGGGFLGGADTRYEVTITSITDKVIKGNFTGSFLRNIADDNDLLSITEGEFVIQRVR